MPYEKVGNNEPVCIADEVPFDIPDSWEWIRLGELCDIINGFTPLKTNPDFWSNGTIPWFTIDDVHSQGRRITFTNKHITTNALSKNSNRLLPSNTVLLCCTASVGEYAITEIPLTTNQQFNGLVIKEYYKEYYSPEFLFELVQTFKDRLINVAGKTTFNFVSVKKLGKLLIPILPLKEQERIIIKIRSVMPEVKKYNAKEIEINELNIQFPNLLKKSILQEAVQGKLVPQGPNDEPASVLLERIRAEKQALIKAGKIKKDKHESVIFRRDNSHYEKRGSEEVCIDDEILFEVPSSWTLIRLNDIGIYRKGPFGSSLTKSMFVPKSDDTVKVYEQKNAIQKDHTLGTYYITRQYYESKMKSFTVEPGDILVSCAGTIGETYVLPEQIELGIINQALMRMTIYAPIDLNYFLMYFDYVLKQTAKDSSKGSAIKNIPPFEIFKKLILPLPPIEEQKRIVLKVRELENLCNLLY